MHTANFVSFFISLNDSLDFVIPRADPVGLVPVNLRMRYRTIRKLDCCDALQFSPVSFAVQPPQPFALSDGAAARNNLHIDDTTDDPELHAPAPPSASTHEHPLVLPQLMHL